MFVFGVQGLFIYAVFRPLNSLSKKYVTITLLIVAVLGVVDEIHQSYMPGRFPRGIDVGKDVVGAMLFLYIVLVARFKFKLPLLQKKV
jgi:VanZ family protein